jgi:hypothetical protein
VFNKYLTHSSSHRLHLSNILAGLIQILLTRGRLNVRFALLFRLDGSSGHQLAAGIHRPRGCMAKSLHSKWHSKPKSPSLIAFLVPLYSLSINSLLWSRCSIYPRKTGGHTQRCQSGHFPSSQDAALVAPVISVCEGTDKKRDLGVNLHSQNNRFFNHSHDGEVLVLHLLSLTQVACSVLLSLNAPS